MLRRLVLYASIAAAAVFVVLGLVAILVAAPQGSGGAFVGATNRPPSTTLPPTTVPPTTVPPTTVPPTTVPPTTVPPTTVPAVTVPPTPVPAVTVPPTTTVTSTTVTSTTVTSTTVTSTTVTSTTVTSTTVTSTTGGPGTTPTTTTPPGTTPPGTTPPTTTPPTTLPVSTLPPTPTSTLPPPSATTTTPEPVQPELPTTSGSPGKAINAIEDMKEQINNNLTPGALAFNNPARMGLGETTTIQLVVESSVSGVEAAPSVTEPGTVITADIEVAATMQAILRGRSFEIVALTPEIQTAERGRRVAVADHRHRLRQTGAGSHRERSD